MSAKKSTCIQPLRVVEKTAALEIFMPLAERSTRHDSGRALDAKKLRTCTREGCSTIVLSYPFCWKHRTA
jgi:hypothetical protein